MTVGRRCLVALLAALCLSGPAHAQGPALPAFPANDPAAWTCDDSPVTAADIDAFCAALPDLGQPAVLPPPAGIDDLARKNAYDLALRQFLHDRAYRGWVHDRGWRLTGPYVGEFGSGQSYGVHPAVRVWYSPEIVRWLCSERHSPLADGAMIIKEMHTIDADALGIDANASCMKLDADPATVKPRSWAVMARHAGATRDGWYWGDMVDFDPAQGGRVDSGNPPVLDRSAVPDPAFLAGVANGPDPAWFPTGDVFGQWGSKATIITPYSGFGGLCINCHASAITDSTFASLENVLGDGLKYRHFAAADPARAADGRQSGAEHAEVATAQPERPDWGFRHALTEPAPGFVAHYGSLGPDTYADAFALRLPAETYDRRTAPPDGHANFVTSDQCLGCHDATISNASTPNMLVDDPRSGRQANVSPYGEWRASPMGLAGRDPIFFSQLQSETNRLPAARACIESTCLHCHGVMGQRQYAADHPDPDEQCSALFGIQPPAGVPSGKPFPLQAVGTWQGPHAGYGALARDGISCTVCHRMSGATFGNEAGYTGNFLMSEPGQIFGPYADDQVLTRPMQGAIGMTPRHGAQITNAGLCGSCHNILLPVFDNAGAPVVVGVVDGRELTHSYEQTTYFEWQNSVYGRSGSGEFRRCQDCHMPTQYAGTPLSGIEIANIESSAFAPTTRRLPDADIALRKRDRFARHSLHGLNLFLNQMAQQFPEILGIRQIDYAGSVQPGTKPSLVTAADSITEMAREQTAKIELGEVVIDPRSGMVEANVAVENLAGHLLPSGVSFRRVFIELTIEDGNGALLWASGRTNALGAILEGTGNRVLDSESGRPGATAFQPHHQTIDRQDQVQIYQELVEDSDGALTTSFLRRARTVKDNRLRPKGFSIAQYARNDSPYLRLIARELRELPSFADPDYSDPQRAGRDVLGYRARLKPADARRVARVSARLYSQAIPPSYLQQRFADAEHGPDRSEIERLYWLTSHLDTGAQSPVPDWKLLLGSACSTRAGRSSGSEAPCRADITVVRGGREPRGSGRHRPTVP